MSKFKLYTGETIEGLGVVTLRQKVEYSNRILRYYCVEVNKENMIKAIKSIKFNGIKQTPVKKDEDILELVLDYTDIFETETETDTYLMLQFDEQDEQEIHLVYRLSEIDDAKQIQFEIYEAIVEPEPIKFTFTKDDIEKLETGLEVINKLNEDVQYYIIGNTIIDVDYKGKNTCTVCDLNDIDSYVVNTERGEPQLIIMLKDKPEYEIDTLFLTRYGMEC
jgi:hypothetical protein